MDAREAAALERHPRRYDRTTGKYLSSYQADLRRALETRRQQRSDLANGVSWRPGVVPLDARMSRNAAHIEKLLARIEHLKTQPMPADVHVSAPAGHRAGEARQRRETERALRDFMSRQRADTGERPAILSDAWS